MTPPANARRALDQAFDAFEDALRRALEAEAQRSVQAYLADLDRNQRFRIEDSDIKVTVSGLTLSTAGGQTSSPSPRRAPRAVKTPNAKGKRNPKGARAGSAREALVGVLLSDSSRSWSTDEIRDGLAAANVEVSPTNLHQLLRRVSATDAVDRVGRGRYQARPAS